MRKILIAVVALSLSACATRHTLAPAVTTQGRVGQIQVINDQVNSPPRRLFSDGITAITTDYTGWTNVVISKIEPELRQFRSSETKILRVSIASINCGGHYVPDCSVSLQIERGDGVRKIYATETRNGYPLSSALEKALDDSVGMALGDDTLVAYLRD